MIFNFRLVSDEIDNFKREIKIDADATFFDLKNAICESVGYDKNEMSSFFLCDSGWEKEKEITLEDMGTDSDEDTYLMDECVLSDYIDDEGQKLMFVFDYLTDRAFFLEMKEIITNKILHDPLCQRKEGKAPAQLIDIDVYDQKMDAATADLGDLGEDFYGDQSYDDEELSSLEGIEGVDD